MTRRRRFVLATIGALSGALGGIGASIVLTQGGHVDVRAVYTLPVLGVTFGAVVGFLDLQKRWNRAASVLVAISTLVIGVLGFADPALSQSQCQVEVTVDGSPQNLAATTQGDPLRIDLSSVERIGFAVDAPGVTQGTVEVTARSVEPFSFLVSPDATVVYFDTVAGGQASATLQVEQTGPTGFVVVGPGYRSPMIPLGVVELGVVVDDTASGVRQVVCDDQAWVRVVARPVSNTTGLVGLTMSILGLVGFVGMTALKDVWRPPPPPPPPPVRISIPAAEPHSDCVKARILDDHGAQVDIASGLVADRPYRLELTLNPGLSPREDEETETTPIAVSGESAGISVEPVIVVGLAGTPLSLELPIVPRRSGRQEVVVDVTSSGHLLQTERIAVSVVDTEAAVSTTEGQTARTVFSGSDLSTGDLSRRRPRALLMILEREADGTVDVRIREPGGNLIVAYDSKLQPAALAEAADDMRTQLQTALDAGPGKQHNISRDQLESVLLPLVKAGRQLHLALFPKRSVRSGDAAEVRARLTDGAIVQVIQSRAGLGYSTLPWHLVYDHEFLPHTERNRLCPDFPGHGVDACPHRDDPEVICPTGFWGYRTIVEEPWIATETAILPPPFAGAGDVAIGYLDPRLGDSRRQAKELRRFGIEPVAGLDQLIDTFRNASSSIGFLYFYAHHDRDADIGTPGIAVGDELLSSLTFDALHLDWASHPLVFVNGCGSGDYAITDPLSLLEEFRDAGACGVVTTECTLWDPLAGRLGRQVIEALANGGEIGQVLHGLRRSLLDDHHNPMGFVYRLQALSDTTVQLSSIPPDIAVDLRTTEPARKPQP